MKQTKRLTLLLFLAAMALTGMNCKKEETTMDKIKRKTREAAEKTNEAVKEATED